MSALQPVRPPASAGAGRFRLLAAFLLGALAVAVIKPWGSGGVGQGSVADAPATPRPAAVSTPSPRPSGLGFNGLDYDPAIFGLHEPTPGWAIWPAGYLVTFGFVIQLSGDAAASASPPSSAAATPPPQSAAPLDLGPAWPSSFEVPEGNHLFLIGVNMPRNYALRSASLRRIVAVGNPAPQNLVQLTSPWPDHFVSLGIPTGGPGSILSVWPAGDYELELGFDPGAVHRSIGIRVAGSPVP